jgi:hypothetical protein
VKHQTELEAQYAWQRKGKKYKTKYFAALGQLFGDKCHDKDCQAEALCHSQRGSGTDSVGDMATEARHKILRDS